MERRSCPTRRLLATAACAAVALVGTSCGADGPLGSPPAATVNGHEISSTELIDTVADQRRFIELLGEGAEAQRAEQEAQAPTGQSAEQLAEDVAQELARFDGAGAGTLAADTTAGILGQLINDQISEEALDVAGATVTDADRDAVRGEVETQVAERGLEVDDVPPAVLDQIVEQRAIRTVIEATAPAEVTEIPVTSAEEYERQLRSIYDADPDQFEALCVNVLLGADEAAGQDARSRVEAGESFQEVAADVSPDEIDGASNGGGGCPARAQVVEILGEDAATAEQGDLVGPAMVQDGRFLLAQVDTVEALPYEQVRDQLAQANPNTQGEELAAAALEEYVQGVFDEATERSEVTVDPIYGTWSPAAATVVPPVDPGASRLVPTEGREAAPVGAEDPAAGP